MSNSTQLNLKNTAAFLWLLVFFVAINPLPPVPQPECFAPDGVRVTSSGWKPREIEHPNQSLVTPDGVDVSHVRCG